MPQAHSQSNAPQRQTSRPARCRSVRPNVRRIAVCTARRTAAAFVGAVALWMWQPANAQLKVSDSVIEMRASDQSTTIEMSNTGSAPLQVSIDLSAVLAPGILGPSNEITHAAQSESMHIEPNNFEILPNQIMSVKVHRTARDLDSDEIFRMRVTPTSKQSQSGMNIRLSYDLLVMVRPDKSSPDIRLSKTYDEIALVNFGNSNALLSSMQMCDELIGHCQSLPNLRLHTRQILPLPIPPEFDLNHTVIKTVQTHRTQAEQINYRLPTVSVSR